LQRPLTNGTRRQGRDHEIRSLIRFLFDFALPQDQHPVAQRYQILSVLPIALGITRELRFPIRAVAARARGLPAPRVLMPKAAVDENGEALFAENDIGFAW
jgi:hypothetical protein